MRAWNFVGKELSDGRPIPPDGKWLAHNGNLVMNERGYHASRYLIDALQYASGSTICHVEVSGVITGTLSEIGSKLVAEKGRILWRVDGEAVLRAFARWCALQVIGKWHAPDVVIEWLTTGNEKIRSTAQAAVLTKPWYITDDATKSAYKATEDFLPWWTAWEAADFADRWLSWYAQEKQIVKMAQEARAGKTEWIFELKDE